jgi:hypothetical protein
VVFTFFCLHNGASANSYIAFSSRRNSLKEICNALPSIVSTDTMVQFL